MQECEMCGEKHRLKDGLCKKCDKSLDDLIHTATVILEVASVVLPYMIGMSIINEHKQSISRQGLIS